MLRPVVFAILAFCGSAFGSGELSILKSPKSMIFKGSDPLPSGDLYDLVYASLGYGVSSQANWTGLYILDPFYLPTSVIAVTVKGLRKSTFHLEEKVDADIQTYPIQGKDAPGALDVVGHQLMTDGSNVCQLNFDQEIVSPRLKQTRPPLADYAPGSGSGIVQQYSSAKDLPADMAFLRNIDYLKSSLDEIAQLQKDCQLLDIYFPMQDVVYEHGADSPKTMEAQSLLNKLILELKSFVQKYDSHDRNLMISIFDNTPEDLKRSRRQAADGDEAKEKTDEKPVEQGSETMKAVSHSEGSKNFRNLAKNYDADFAAMFNIILWFVVAFFFALLAICYTIGTMDPGRDSIIYRMTSTRMKKDN